jgi:hypothetical protein
MSAIFDSLTDHSPLDGTNTPITGAQVDANPQVIAQILDGTTGTDLATSGTVDVRFTASRVGLRFIATDVAAASVYDALTIEWDPSDGSNLTDGSSGLGMIFRGPNDTDNQVTYARIAAIVESDVTSSETASLSFRAMVGGSMTEVMNIGSGGLVWNETGADVDIRFEGDTVTDVFVLNAGEDRVELNKLAMRVDAPLRIDAAAGTKWSLGWWQSTDLRWWLLGDTSGAATFTRADAEFYIPTGNIADVPSS